VAPNAFTFVFCLKACAIMQDSITGLKLHKDLVEDGLEGYKVVGNALVSMYAKLGLYEEAGSVLHELPDRDVVSWTALICEYAEDGLGEEALHTLEQMLAGGFSPNAITYMCCLKACGSIGAVKKGRMLHMDIAKRGLETNSLIANALVDMYAECGESFELKSQS
jgi:pentatricopeptide repeat protein